ncbi:MAG: MEDS domain-containing protein [Balneolales bacterium]
MRNQLLLEQEILNLEDKNHLCLIYEKDPLEQMPALIPYIKQGLENKERFIYIADDISIEQLTLLLKISHVDVAAEKERGALKLLTKKDWVEPGVDIAKESQKLRNHIASALEAGFCGVRFAIEMTWTLGQDIEVCRLEKWERTIDTIFTPDIPAKMICQYNRSLLNESVVKQAFKTHSHAIIGDCLCANKFHEADEEDEVFGKSTIDSIIGLLRENYEGGIKKASPTPLNFKNLKWGTHICNFYKTQADLVEILVPYFKAGLENNEFCIWITSKPLGKKEAFKALRNEVPDLDGYLENNQLEILDASEFYMTDHKFKPLQEVLDYWENKEKKALSDGFKGLRASGNTYWLERQDWNQFDEYENQVNESILHSKMMALCSYSLDKCTASDIVDVVSSHQITFIKKNGKFRVIENNEYLKAETKILEVIRELENTVQTRTSELSKSIDEKEILLKEIHHRVKNNLQIITSLLRLQSKNITDDKILKECQNRIQSMALVHEALYKSDNLASLNLNTYINALGKELFTSYNLNPQQVTMEVNVNDVPLDLDKSISCGLILNELITNSIKYAFSDNREGLIKIDFDAVGDRGRLSVSDNGVGLANGLDIDNYTTLGMRLIKTFTAQLDGKLEIRNGQGLTFDIDFPLEQEING